MAILFAFLAPLFYAISNFIDKYALGKHFEQYSTKTYIASIGVIGLPFLAALAGIVSYDLPDMDPLRALMAFGAGLLFSCGIMLYLVALQSSDASLVGGLFQLIVVFNFVFGSIFLGERISTPALISAAVVLIACIAFAYEQKEDGGKFHFASLALMIGATLLISLSDISFKASAIDGGNYLVSQFFEYLATVVLGIFILLVSRRVRSDFSKMSRSMASLGLVGIIFLNELVNLTATVLQRRASLEMNLTVMQTILGMQPLYLVIIGIILTKLVPKIISENITRKHLMGKLASLTAMLIGTVGVLVFSR